MEGKFDNLGAIQLTPTVREVLKRCPHPTREVSESTYEPNSLALWIEQQLAN